MSRYKHCWTVSAFSKTLMFERRECNPIHASQAFCTTYNWLPSVVKKYFPTDVKISNLVLHSLELVWSFVYARRVRKRVRTVRGRHLAAACDVVAHCSRRRAPHCTESTNSSTISSPSSTCRIRSTRTRLTRDATSVSMQKTFKFLYVLDVYKCLYYKTLVQM